MLHWRSRTLIAGLRSSTPEQVAALFLACVRTGANAAPAVANPSYGSVVPGPVALFTDRAVRLAFEHSNWLRLRSFF